jgi:hypothetical protein
MICERLYGIMNVPHTGRGRQTDKDGNVQSWRGGRGCIGDETVITFEDLDIRELLQEATFDH